MPAKFHCNSIENDEQKASRSNADKWKSTSKISITIVVEYNCTTSVNEVSNRPRAIKIVISHRDRRPQGLLVHGGVGAKQQIMKRLGRSNFIVELTRFRSTHTRASSRMENPCRRVPRETSTFGFRFVTPTTSASSSSISPRKGHCF